MAMDASGNYSPRPWMDNPPIQVRLKKPAYNSYDDEIRVADLVDNLSTPSEVIRQIRPPVGNIPFPERFGYEQSQPTIADVLSIGSFVLMKDTATRQESGLMPGTGPGLAQW